MQTAVILFKEKDFLLYVASRFAATIGQSLQSVAVTWQIYQVTGSALQIALLGLARFIPALLISLIGGAVADMRDRRMVLAGAQIATTLTSVIFLAMTAADSYNLTVVYLLVGFLGFVGSFENPARQSLLPQVVPANLYQRAVAFAATSQQLSMAVGPMIAGFLIASLGLAQTYAVHVALGVLSTVVLPLIQVKYGSTPRGSFSVAMVKEGITYVRDHRAVLGAMTIDLFAVIFAGATALLPIYAEEILGVGAVGFGMLTAASAVGSFAMAFCLTFLPPINAAGRALTITIAGFSIFTILFGFSTNFLLSLLIYAIVGGFDQIGVVMRSIIIQMGTPDALRGRVSAVNFVFVGASNQLSQVRAGIVADRTNPVFSVVSGGVLCLLSSLLIVRLIPELWRYRSDAETEAPRS